MYKFYLVPNATTLNSHAAIYTSMKLFWDPRAESDAYAIVDPVLKGELGKADSLDFTILPANIHYDDFHKRKTVVVVYDDDEWLFEGVVTDCPVDFFKQRKVSCSGVLSYLCDSIKDPDEQTILTIPDAGDKTRYLPVPESWYYDARPHSLRWCERYVEEGIVYFDVTEDAYVDWSKQYYYAADGSRPEKQNVSGESVTKKVPTVESIRDHIERCLDSHNEQVDPFKQINLGTTAGGSTEHDFWAANFRSTWEAIKSDVLDSYGRYLRIRLGNDHNLYLDYINLSGFSSHESPVIEYTVNMIEMSETNGNNDDIFTILMPLGKDNLTVSAASGGGIINDHEPYIATFGGERRYVVVSKDALREFGHIIKTESFTDMDTADKLYERSLEYISNNYVFNAEYNVKAIDLHFIDSDIRRIHVGEKCQILSQWHGVDERDSVVITAEHNLMNPESDSYTIGIPTSDRDAKNKTLTEQTRSAEAQNRAAQASMASSASNTGSILDNYIHVTEWGLELSSRWKNELEADNEMFKTRFLQDEYHINLAAQKIFGDAQDNNQDAGYMAVPSTDYYDKNGMPKIPTKEHWYIKNSDGKYVLSTIDTNQWNPTPPPISDKNGNPIGDGNFYIQRLWTRYSELDVGPGGIKARVDGNYERSTASSSWIDSNEDSIIAITGHIHVDENGQVIIDSGVGARTGHTESINDPKFLLVPASWRKYSESPHLKGWYERVLKSDGSWKGEGKADAQKNSEYYRVTDDIHPIEGKYYYYYSRTSEKFVAEYGLYDKGNLTAGIIVNAINNPQYIEVTYNERNTANRNPQASGWYVANPSTGTFGLTLDTTVDPNTTYYKVNNNFDPNDTYTWVKGKRVVVGGPDNYEGLPAGTQAKVNQYIRDHDLDGTITEIASDVVVVNTLLAKYVEADDIVANTSLWADYIWTNNIHVREQVLTQGTVYIDVGSQLSPNGYNVADGIKGFGEPIYDGDTVTLPFWKITDYTGVTPGGGYSYSGSVTFTKPASLGSVTWSSGNNTLTAKTVGGRDFLVGRIKNYVPSGQDEASAMNNAAYLEGETSGYNTVYGIYYTTKASNGNSISQKTMLFRTPKDRYDDGIAYAKTKFGILAPPIAATTTNTDEGAALGRATTLDYGSSYMYYSLYDGSRQSAKQYFKTPSKGSYRTYASYGGTTYTSGTINLGYSGSVTVYGQRKMDDDSSYTSATGITIKAPASNATSHNIQMGDPGTFDTYTYEPSGGTELTKLVQAIKTAQSSGEHWLAFHVTCGTESKMYKMYFG